MNKRINDYNTTILKLAIQKRGRLTDESIDFLRRCGLSFELSQQRLYSWCVNFPLKIFYVRNADIGRYVENNIVDIGIVGQNILNENRPKVKKILNLRFGFCSLVLAVPKNSNLNTPKQLKGKTIATSYPNSTKRYFQSQKIPVEIISLSGSVEIAPSLKLCSAIVDLMATGSTLRLNELKIIDKIYHSEAVLISSRNLPTGKSKLLNQLTIRFKSVLSAKDYKNVLISVPSPKLPKLKKILAESRSFIQLFDKKNKKFVVQLIIREDILWQKLSLLKSLNLSVISVLPVEKIIVY